jgi:hypothetical protein
MTKQELREEIKMLHFPDIPPERLPDALLNSQIIKAYKRAVTMGHTYPQNTDVTLVDGTYDLANIADYYEPRYFAKDDSAETKYRKMEIENLSSIPVVGGGSTNFYYLKEKNLYIINGDDEDVSVVYWAYPAAITADTTTFTALADEFSGVIVSRVCWILAQGLNPKMVSGYIASYNEEFKTMKAFYIKKFRAGRGYTMPMDY